MEYMDIDTFINNVSIRSGKQKDETEQNFFESSLMPQEPFRSKMAFHRHHHGLWGGYKKRISYSQNRPGEMMTVIKNYSMRVLWNSDWAARG